MDNILSLFIYNTTIFMRQDSNASCDNTRIIFNRVFLSLGQFDQSHVSTETCRKLNCYIIPNCLLFSKESFKILLSNTKYRYIVYTSHRFPVKNDICKEVGKVKIQF